MIVETKFDIGQKIYFNKSLIYYVDGKDKVISGIITGLFINNTFTWYEIDNREKLLEQYIYETRDKALQALKEQE